MIVPHQANRRIMDNVVHRLDLDESQCLSTIERYGNSGCASTLITLAEWNDGGTAEQMIVCVTFGGGSSRGAAGLWAIVMGLFGCLLGVFNVWITFPKAWQ